MKTLKQLLDQVNGEIGFDIPSAYIGNTDPNIAQLVAVANRSATNLRELGLQKILKFCIIDLTDGTVVPDTDSRIKAYDLPDDFYSYVPDTTYQNGRLDNAILPTSPSIWSYLISRQGQDTLPIRCRIIDGQLQVFTPQHGQTLEFQYISTNTIAAAPTIATREPPTATKGTFTVDTDIWLLDDPLIELDIKWRYKREKGLDWEGDRADYQVYENAVRGRDSGSRTVGWPTNDWPYPNEPFTNLWVT